MSFLDLCRWLAAALVFVGHLRNPLFLGYGAALAEDRTTLVKAWYFVTGWHAEAVLVFFVLSGFLVGGVACARLKQGTFDGSSYAIDRVTRLYVPLIPALLLTLLLDSVAVEYFSSSGFYDRTHPQTSEKIPCCIFKDNATLPLLVANIAMLQTVLTESLGSNLPLWTISLEFWFYVVFGIAAVGLASRSRVVGGVAIGAALVLAAVLGLRFQISLGLWLIGVGAALVPWRAVERPLAALLAFCAVLVAVRLANNEMDRNLLLKEVAAFATALSFAWLLVSMRGVRLQWLQRLGAFNKRMADFSYSLYLIHMPLMFFLLAALHATGAFPGIARGYSPVDPIGLGVYALVIVIVVVSAWLFSLATEMQTHHVRTWLKRRITASRPVVPPEAATAIEQHPGVPR